MAAPARLKNEFMEDKKWHNLMTWLNLSVFITLCKHLYSLYEGCSLISATGFVTRISALSPESEH